MPVQLIEIIGIAASIATSLQIVGCYTGQLQKLMHCSPLEARGMHFGLHLFGTVSHGLWFVAGIGLKSTIIAVPNGIGAVLALLISAQLTLLRRADTKTPTKIIA